MCTRLCVGLSYQVWVLSFGIVESLPGREPGTHRRTDQQHGPRLFDQLACFGSFGCPREIPRLAVVGVVNCKVKGQARGKVLEPAPHELERDAWRRIDLTHNVSECAAPFSLVASSREAQMFKDEVGHLIAGVVS